MKAFSGAKRPVTLSRGRPRHSGSAPRRRGRGARAGGGHLASKAARRLPGPPTQGRDRGLRPGDKPRLRHQRPAENDLDIFDFSNVAAPAPVIVSVDLSSVGRRPQLGRRPRRPRRGRARGRDPAGASARSSSSTPTEPIWASAGAGALPDMLTFTRNGNFLLVANEGEPWGTNGLDRPRGFGHGDRHAPRPRRPPSSARPTLRDVRLRGPVRLSEPRRDLQAEGHGARVHRHPGRHRLRLDPGGERCRDPRHPQRPSSRSSAASGFKDWRASPRSTLRTAATAASCCAAGTTCSACTSRTRSPTTSSREKKKVKCDKGPDKGELKCLEPTRPYLHRDRQRGRRRATGRFSPRRFEVQSDLTLERDRVRRPTLADSSTTSGELKVTSNPGRHRRRR